MTEFPESPAAHPSARDVLQDMWKSRRTEAEADIEALLSALTSLADSPADAELRQQAQRRAHQLVGVFGIFGFIDVKNQMARVDIELSDASLPIADLISRVDEIRSQLP